MVRVRYESEIHWDIKEQYPDISLDFDNQFIVIENEKNNDSHFFFEDKKFQEIILEVKTIDNLFNVISIQTVTSCNMTCSFCPVNKNSFKREAQFMSWQLIEKIARELNEIKYEDQILLFTNNEPLLDDRMCDVIALFRNSCPKASIKILTNGILLNEDLVDAMFFNGLSILTINNYTDGQKLINPVKSILKNASKYINEDIRIYVRHRNAILTTRAGQAPNKSIIGNPYEKSFCALPFTDFNISHSGKVIQCCFDALANSNYGDVNKLNLLEIWNSEFFQVLRKHLVEIGRTPNFLCKGCDFDGFRSPYHYSKDFKRPMQ